MNTNTENKTNNLWRNNIYHAIKNISDLESQKLIWTGKSLNFQSSYDEYIMNLYDDFDFNKFLTLENKLSMGIPEKLYSELIRLDALLNSYSKEKTDIEILLDGDWHNVTKQASQAIMVWNSIY